MVGLLLLKQILPTGNSTAGYPYCIQFPLWASLWRDFLNKFRGPLTFSNSCPWITHTQLPTCVGSLSLKASQRPHIPLSLLCAVSPGNSRGHRGIDQASRGTFYGPKKKPPLLLVYVLDIQPISQQTPFFGGGFIFVTWNKKGGRNKSCPGHLTLAKSVERKRETWKPVGICRMRFFLLFFTKNNKAHIFVPSTRKEVRKSWYSYNDSCEIVCVIPGGIYTLDISPVQCRHNWASATPPFPFPLSLWE